MGIIFVNHEDRLFSVIGSAPHIQLPIVAVALGGAESIPDGATVKFSFDEGAAQPSSVENTPSSRPAVEEHVSTLAPPVDLNNEASVKHTFLALSTASSPRLDSASLCSQAMTEERERSMASKEDPHAENGCGRHTAAERPARGDAAKNGVCSAGKFVGTSGRLCSADTQVMKPDSALAQGVQDMQDWAAAGASQKWILMRRAIDCVGDIWLPEGWKMRMSRSFSRVFYYNVNTGVRRWTRPIEEKKMAGVTPVISPLSPAMVPTPGASDPSCQKDEAFENDAWNVGTLGDIATSPPPSAKGRWSILEAASPRSDCEGSLSTSSIAIIDKFGGSPTALAPIAVSRMHSPPATWGSPPSGAKPSPLRSPQFLTMRELESLPPWPDELMNALGSMGRIVVGDRQIICTRAEFGLQTDPCKGSAAVRGQVARADPWLADTDFLSSERLRGKVALIGRGGCPFTDKARRAQKAGAIAVVIVNNADVLFNVLGQAKDVRVPVVSVTKSDGDTLSDGCVASIIWGVHLKSVSNNPNSPSSPVFEGYTLRSAVVSSPSRIPYQLDSRRVR